jgi:hypothetical protein
MDTTPWRGLPTRDALLELTTVLGELMKASEAQAAALRILAQAIGEVKGQPSLCEEVGRKLDESSSNIAAAFNQTLAVLDAMAPRP